MRFPNRYRSAPGDWTEPQFRTTPAKNTGCRRVGAYTAIKQSDFVSFSVEMNEIPQRTIMHVSVGDNMVFLEAWAEDEGDKRALEAVSKELKEGDRVLVEAEESGSGRQVCGARRVDFL